MSLVPTAVPLGMGAVEGGGGRRGQLLHLTELFSSVSHWGKDRRKSKGNQ